MIIGFAGTPGSGKTYEAVSKIIANLKTGRIVYTNIEGISDPACLEMIKNVVGLSDFGIAKLLHVIEPEQVPEFWLHVSPGCLIVLDEVQKVFGSREWQTAKNNMFASWASTHRHHGFDLVLITQAIERIDSAVRALIEWTYIFRKVNFLGGAINNKYLCYSYNGEDTSCPPLTKETRSYNKQIFQCYKSYVSKDVTELGVMKHVNILKHPVFFAIPIVLCFTIYMVFFKSSIGTGDIFGTGAATAHAEKVKQSLKDKDKKVVVDEKKPSIFPMPSLVGSAIASPAQPAVSPGQTVPVVEGNKLVRLDHAVTKKGIVFLHENQFISKDNFPGLTKRINGQWFAVVPASKSS